MAVGYRRIVFAKTFRSGLFWHRNASTIDRIEPGKPAATLISQATSTGSDAETNLKTSFDCKEDSSKVVKPVLPPPWKDPWLYAEGRHRYVFEPPKYTNFVESKEEFSWVERLFPSETIPEIPKHASYPTPSGWQPPNPPQDLPYYVRRTRFHMFPLYLERRRDGLDLTTMDVTYCELVRVTQIEGDVFAAEADIKDYIFRKLGRKVATHVNEPQGIVRIRDVDRTVLEKWLIDCGF